jgi:hypothetical protein
LVRQLFITVTGVFAAPVILVAAVAIMLSLWRFVIDRGQVGPSTTWVTGPVRLDGYIDYFAASNEIRGDGIPPHEDAAIDLLRAVGPGHWDSELFANQWSILTARVPLADAGQYEVPETGFYLAPPEAIWGQLREAECRPWKRDEFPGVSHWVDANEQALQLIHQASMKVGFWLPLVPDDGDEDRRYAETLYSGAFGVARVQALARCRLGQCVCLLVVILKNARMS